MKRVYLCGPITGITYEQAEEGWRQYAEKFLAGFGIESLSPMRGKYFLKGIGGPIGDNLPHMEAEAVTSRKGIVTRDRWDVQRCDVVLANLTGAGRISIGSVVEYGWADAFRKPIVTVIEKGGNVHEHSFIRELSGFVYDDLDEALANITALLNGRPV